MSVELLSWHVEKPLEAYRELWAVILALDAICVALAAWILRPAWLWAPLLASGQALLLALWTVALAAASAAYGFFLYRRDARLVQAVLREGVRERRKAELTPGLLVSFILLLALFLPLLVLAALGLLAPRGPVMVLVTLAAGSPWAAVLSAGELRLAWQEVALLVVRRPGESSGRRLLVRRGLLPNDQAELSALLDRVSAPVG